VVGKAASIAVQTWVRNNDKTEARAEEREKNIGWIKRLFTAWRVSHAERNERRAERKEAGEDDPEEDDTPVVISSSAVTMHPKGTPAPPGREGHQLPLLCRKMRASTAGEARLPRLRLHRHGELPPAPAHRHALCHRHSFFSPLPLFLARAGCLHRLGLRAPEGSGAVESMDGG